MIPRDLRARLTEFIKQHKECDDPRCLYQRASDWADDIERRSHKREELLLMGLAYQAYVSKTIDLRRRLRLEQEANEDFIPPPPRNRPNLKVVP